jgi:hypothetical protein
MDIFEPPFASLAFESNGDEMVGVERLDVIRSIGHPV